jgi:simple sugar transport system ATP-binding protein
MGIAVDMKGISKYFASSDVLANDNVDFSVEQGEVHALVGENGAGKSTLMNVLYGLIKMDTGQISIMGQQANIPTPDAAISLGIGMVHQHFKLVPSFTVAENIMLGMESTTLGVLRKNDEIEQVQKLADDFGMPVDPTARIRDLPVGMQQRVEILKTLQRNANIIILDEPTAVLTPPEVAEFMEIVRGLADRGQTVIFITHKLVEVTEVADRVSVMRGGKMVGTRLVKETDIPEMARMMVGREVLFRVEKGPANPGDAVFETKNLTIVSETGRPAVTDVSFHVREGEIYGLAGVSGNGQKELVDGIAGITSGESGWMRLLDNEITNEDVASRRELGMAHIPEDRVHVGLNMLTTMQENTLVSRQKLPEYNQWGFLIRDAVRNFAQTVIDRFSVVAASPEGGVSMLSGGNMQKVVVGRELSGNPKFIIANQPTRGLDVGSIEFVHKTLIEARDNGAAILLISVELDEIMSLADRIGVIFRGQIVGEFEVADATEENIGLLMAGGSLSKPKDIPESVL